MWRVPGPVQLCAAPDAWLAMEELAARVPSPEQRVPSPEVRAPISQGPDYQATAEGTASAGGGVLKKVSRARARAEAEAAALMFARRTPRAQVIFVKEVPKPDAEASAGSSWFSYKGSTGRMSPLGLGLTSTQPQPKRLVSWLKRKSSANQVASVEPNAQPTSCSSV